MNYSFEEINFLDTTVKINSKNQITTTLYKKSTDRQSYLHHKSYHPTSTKKSIPYSQALRLSRVCSEDDDYHSQLLLLKEKFLEKGYTDQEITTQFNKATSIAREETLTYKVKKPFNKMVFSTTYNKSLPDIKKGIEDNWHILSINTKISEIFTETPIIAYKRNDNLKKLIGQNKLSNNKKVTHKNLSKKGKCSPCHSRRGNLCCLHVKDTTTFTNRITKQVFSIFDHLNCKSSYLIYLLECTKCNNKPYVGKCETPGNERINTHRHDAKSFDSIPVDAHFMEPGHNFNIHAKFTFIEKVRKNNISKFEMTRLLKQREDFWMLKLQTLKPNGFNVELNFPQSSVM